MLQVLNVITGPGLLRTLKQHDECKFAIERKLLRKSHCVLKIELARQRLRRVPTAIEKRAQSRPVATGRTQSGAVARVAQRKKLFDTILSMTKLIQEEITVLRHLPEERQAVVIRAILEFASHEELEE